MKRTIRPVKRMIQPVKRTISSDLVGAELFSSELIGTEFFGSDLVKKLPLLFCEYSVSEKVRPAK